MTTSLLAGILNAPWKTNEDRQNLLDGPYNDELLEAAANMVADALPRLSTPKDPGRHLDALPRRHESGDNDHSDYLRRRLYDTLRGRRIVPNQDGVHRKILEISYPPDGLANKALECWARHGSHPADWLHHSALTPNRLARLGLTRRSYTGFDWDWPEIKRASIAEWLEALTENVESEQDKIQASRAAIQTAVLIPDSIREDTDLGEILLTADNTLVKPNPNTVRLGNGGSNAERYVHPDLQEDLETLNALKELGIKPESPETIFVDFLSALLLPDSESPEVEWWNKFWQLARDVDEIETEKIIRESPHYLTSKYLKSLRKVLDDTFLSKKYVDRSVAESIGAGTQISLALA